MLADLRALNEVQARHPVLRGAVAQVGQLRRRLESELRPLRRRAVWRATGFAVGALLCLAVMFLEGIHAELATWSTFARAAALLMLLLLFLGFMFASMAPLETYQRRAIHRVAELLAPLLGRLESGEPSDFLERFALVGMLPAKGQTLQEFRLRLTPAPVFPQIASLAYLDKEGLEVGHLWLLAVSLPGAAKAPPLDLRSGWPRRWLLNGDPLVRCAASGDADFDKRFRCHGDSVGPPDLSPALRRTLLALRAAGGPVAARLQHGALLLAWQRKRRNFRELPHSGALVGERALPRILQDWGLLLDVAAAYETSAAKRAPQAAR